MSEFRYGDRVKHRDYGNGWVEEYLDTGTVLVTFDGTDGSVTGCSPISLSHIKEDSSE